MKQKRVTLAIGCALMLSASPASAVVLTANVGASFLNGAAYQNTESPSLLLGGELTFGLTGLLELGAFYDYTKVSSSTAGIASGSLGFYGAVLRVGLGPVTNLFVDGKIGMNQYNVSGTSSDSAIGYGVGLGYSVGIAPLISLKPHLGYRYLPVKALGSTTNGSSVDASVLVSFGF